MILKIIDWFVRIFLGVAFGAASYVKLTSHPGMVKMFSDFGLPGGFYWIVGVVELAGAVLILIPATRRLSVVLLGIVVLGASLMHLLHDPFSKLVGPVVFAAALALVWYLGGQRFRGSK